MNMFALRSVLIVLLFPALAAAQPTTNQQFASVKFPTSVTFVPNGAVMRTSAIGLTVSAVAGSVYDFGVYTPNGVSPIIAVPTGTTDLMFGGTATFGPTAKITLSETSLGVSMTAAGGLFGTGNKTGAAIVVGSNTSGGGSAAVLNLLGKAAGFNYIWADASGTPGVLRISTAAPEEDGTPSDTSGTVVGSQSSSLDTKNILGPGVSPSDALDTMLRTPTFRFAYKGGSYSGTIFQGIVTDWSPEFGMDPDAAHPGGRSFNPVNALGYTVQAVKALQAEIDELLALVAALQQAPP